MKHIYLDTYQNKWHSRTGRQNSLGAYADRIKNYSKTTNKWGIVYAARCKNTRSKSDIVNFTGLLFIDVDKCTDHVAVKNLFKRIRYTVMTYYSRSGKNVHAVIKIPVCKTVDEYERRFSSFMWQVEDHLEGIAELDTMTANPVQMAFHSYDPEIFIKDNPETFELIDDPVVKPEVKKPISYNTGYPKQGGAIAYIRKVIPNIVSPGYVTLRSKSVLIGGWCGAGEAEAEKTLQALLEAITINQYFLSDDSDKDIDEYQTLAESAFNEGFRHPIKMNY